MSPVVRVFTIGHSTHPIEKFVALLQQHQIERVADVRSTPFSRFNPQFNRAPLAQQLAAAGIEYEFMGDELGARTTDPGCFENGRVSYRRLAATPQFRRGLARLRQVAENQRVAILCAEREPLDCHRTILVGRELERAGDRVTHILADGSLEENRDAIRRLIAQLGLPADDLFGETAELIGAAYDRQAEKIAYVPKAEEGSRSAARVRKSPKGTPSR